MQDENCTRVEAVSNGDGWHQPEANDLPNSVHWRRGASPEEARVLGWDQGRDILDYQRTAQRDRIQTTLVDRSAGSQKNRAADVEGVYRLEPKKEPATLHIRVVQRLQSSEALTIDLGVEHSECAQHLVNVWETNIDQGRCWNGSKQRSGIRRLEVRGKHSSPFIIKFQ
jgi:hypothetical protein